VVAFADQEAPAGAGRDGRRAGRRLLRAGPQQHDLLVASATGRESLVRGSVLRQARWMYRRSRGSTLIRSPTLTKSGTCTTAPVSSVAGFVTFETVSPLTPGSVSVTASTTDAGRSTPDGCPSTNSTCTTDDGCMNGSSPAT